MGNSVERYYQRKKKRKKRAKIVMLSMLVVLMLLVLGILSVTVFFNAETILVEGNTHYSADALLKQGGLKVGQNLFRLDKFEVIEKMEQLPYVKEVSINRKLPNTLEITVIENQPVVWLETPTGAALLNEEYRVLELLELPKEVLPAPAAPEQETETDQAEEQPEEELPVYSQLEGVPKLVGVTAKKLEVGKITEFKQGDYVGFLQRLYEAACANPEFQWNLVNEVRFKARYDITLLYDERVDIVFGTLDQVDTKLELAVYVLKENGGTVQAATVDVSDLKRQYYSAKNS